jgi:hypothetical protein
MSKGDKPPADGRPDVLALYREPGVKNYLFAGLAALAMVFVVMFQRATDIGGMMLVAIGLGGLLLRWNAAPTLFLLVLSCFLVFPTGIPGPLVPNPYEIRQGRFRVVDMVLVFSVLVYLACQYRVFGLVKQAVPFERLPRKGEHPTRRPAGIIAAGEITRLLYLVAGVVLVGQLVWLFVTGVEVEAGRTFPLRLSGDRRYGFDPDEVPATLSPVSTRFVLLTGVLFFGTLLARLVFGYWRLRVMGPGEAAMVLQEAGWNETRRENVRLAKWQVWGRERAAARAKSDRGTGI